MTTAAEPDAGPAPDTPPPRFGNPIGRALGRLSGSSRKGIKGVGWSGLAQVVNLVVRLGSNLLLTRLLSPEDWGILGPAMAVLTTLEWFSDFGVGPALIRHPDGMEPRYLLTGFWIGAGRGVALTLAAAAVAWPYSALNGTPALTPILLAMSLRSAIVGLRSPAFPRLRRELEYRSIFLDEVLTLLLGTATTLILAWRFHTYWAIVAGGVVSAIGSVATSYYLAPYRVRWAWDRGVVAEISGLGRQIWVNTLLMAAYMNVDRLLGLRLVGKKEMGLYVVAVGLSQNLDVLFARASDVFFAMLSRQADPEVRRRWGHRVSMALAKYLMPAVSLGIAASPWLIRTLYDSRYLHVGVLLGIMAARAMIRSVGQLQYEYLLSTGDIRANSVAFGAAALSQAALMVPLGARHGSLGLAWALLGSTAVYGCVQTALMRLKGDARLAPLGLTCAWAAAGLGAMFALR